MKPESIIPVTLLFGVAVDMAFLHEMSNLSPPIIYPPPSAL
jgi:hypothetical protein